LIKKPEICVLKTDGINCDAETAFAFEQASGAAKIVHINQLREHTEDLKNFQGLAIPGGFSYGDDVASGKVLAVELTSHLSEQMQQFVDDGKPVIGICNGFQVLARTGLLPSRLLGEQQVTLANNDSRKFECRWIDLAVGASACKFVRPEDFVELPIPMQVAHGEGKFVTSDNQINRLVSNGQVVFRYATREGTPTSDYPDNPNGSIDNIAGVCDPSGLVLGMMPHPERSVASHHPNRVRTLVARQAGQVIFDNIVHYAKGM
jgi:phosphoribosylformylglycinamidine synthase